MRIDAIRSFLRLVEAGSYTGAAELLFMSPTTLHSHVKSIEDELNMTLVTFDGKRMELTRAGAEFLLFAERTIAEFDVLRDGLAGLTRPSQTTLRIVSLSAPAVHLLPSVVDAFQRVHPDVHVSVDTRRAGEAIAALVSKQADLAIVHEAHAVHVRDVFLTSLLFEDRLAAVIRRNLYEPPDAALMERYPLAVQPSANSLSRQYVERWARERNVQIRAHYEHASFDGILTYVMAADCVGIVGGYVASSSPVAAMIQQLDLPSFDHVRRIVALYPATSNEAVRAFVEFAYSFYAEGALVRGRS
jgi:DNA-binding transcriptional LysR family regulator